MAKGNFFSDMADQALEFGVQSVKSTTQVPKALNPIPKVFESAKTAGQGVDPGIEKNQSSSQKPKSTPLDLKKLDERYKNQDNVSVEAMKHRLFKIVKEGEQKAIMDLKREDEERKKKEAMEEEEKKRRRQQEEQQQAQADMPQGKVRKTLGMTSKKVVQDSKQEFKAGKSSG